LILEEEVEGPEEGKEAEGREDREAAEEGVDLGGKKGEEDTRLGVC
jgi:hypothetical protein